MNSPSKVAIGLGALCALTFFFYLLAPQHWRLRGGVSLLTSAPPQTAACQQPGASRNQLDAASLHARGVRLVSDESGELRFPHSLVDPDCPRFVRALQDIAAGVGHRSREWSTGLWLALTFNLTLVHMPIDTTQPGARREHDSGGFEGWDALLGLPFGEGPQEDSTGLPLELLPSIGSWGAPNDHVYRLWAPRLTAPDTCNIVFQAPGDQSPFDVSPVVRPYMTWKFAAAAAERARAGVHLPLRYSPAAVNVAVHYRVGDMVPTPEASLWQEAALALRSLREQGVQGPVHVHVHTEGAVPLAHFGHAPLVEEGGGGREGDTLELVYHSDMRANETMWHFANADVFVGSRSEFSWLAGMLSPRFTALLQRGTKSHENCADAGTSVCCNNDGLCEEEGQGVLELAAQRIAAAQGCGNIGPRTAVVDEQWPLQPFVPVEE